MARPLAAEFPLVTAVIKYTEFNGAVGKTVYVALVAKEEVISSLVLILSTVVEYLRVLP